MSTEAITSEIKLNGIETTCGVAEIKHLSKYYLYYREQAPIQGSIPSTTSTYNTRIAMWKGRKYTKRGGRDGPIGILKNNEQLWMLNYYLPGRESLSSGCGRRLMFRRSWVRIPAPYFFTLIFVKLYWCLFEKDQKNEKEAGDGPFKNNYILSVRTIKWVFYISSWSNRQLTSYQK